MNTINPDYDASTFAAAADVVADESATHCAEGDALADLVGDANADRLAGTETAAELTIPSPDAEPRPLGNGWEWNEDKEDWVNAEAGPAIPKPYPGVTPELLGGRESVGQLDNLYIEDAMRAASTVGNDPVAAAERFQDVYENMREAARDNPTADYANYQIERAEQLVEQQLASGSVIDHAGIGPVQSAEDAETPNSWGYQAAEWLEDNIDTAREFYLDQSEQGNWVLGGLGQTAADIAAGTADSLRVGGATGAAWDQGGEELGQAIVEDIARGAGLATSLSGGGVAGHIPTALGGLDAHLDRRAESAQD